MKKVLTIDFDIFLRESINLYNDSDESATEFFRTFSFIQTPFDLISYEKITKLLLQYQKSQIVFMDTHDEIVNLTRNEGPFELINIDFHHDLGYGENIKWTLPIKIIDEGNWVKKLWELNRVNKYIWINDFHSDELPYKGRKFLTEQHYIDSYDFDNLLDCDKIYICFSEDYIPDTYFPLFDLWKDIFYQDPEEGISLEAQEQSEQLSFI